MYKYKVISDFDGLLAGLILKIKKKVATRKVFVTRILISRCPFVYGKLCFPCKNLMQKLKTFINLYAGFMVLMFFLSK